jgi:ribonuclease VapC
VLNLLDLMVYAVAKERGMPLLCTGNDFATTDLAIHPASRVG